MTEKKRQDLPPQKIPPGLWVLATPLGNLADLSDRGKQALASADYILCEDTRRTRALLSALGMSGKLVRFDAYVEAEKGDSAPSHSTRRVLDDLSHGQNVALVTDAGTPAIADPGARLIEQVHAQGTRVTPIPGPSAVVTLLSVAGFPEGKFTFHGFFPRTNSDRKQTASTLAAETVHVWYESPQRICECIEFLKEHLEVPHPDAEICAGKELTKIHEALFRGSLADVLPKIAAHIAAQGTLGEWTVALRIPARPVEAAILSDTLAPWHLALECLIEHKVPVSDAAKSVSQKFGVRKNTVYEAALKKASKK